MTLPAVSGELEAFVPAFEQIVASSAKDSFAAKRREAFGRFTALGIPTTKNEDWHYTSAAPIAEHEYIHLTNASSGLQREALAPFLFGSAWTEIVFFNGVFAQELSRLDAVRGVRITELGTGKTASALRKRLGTITSFENDAFTALNTALMRDGAVIEIAADTKVERPIHIVHVTDAVAAKGMMHPRNLIVIGRNAQATVVESYVSTSDALYFTNAVTEIAIEEGATLRHFAMQRESHRAFHVGTVEAHQAKDSHFVSFSFAIGGSLSRTNIYTTLDGPGAGVTLNGLYMLDGEQHCDHQTKIIHAQPNCFSRELYKGVLDGRSHGVFNGKVYVHPIAQKTDGKQTNNTLLLSETAHIDTKPQLEIFADDVKCTHGATVGQIDQLALFYMKSRGVNRDFARRLLTYAFAADVLETIEEPEIREALERLALERFVKPSENGASGLRPPAADGRQPTAVSHV